MTTLTGGFRDLCSDAITAWNTRDERELTALKLAATEQATQAEAVLEERTRERDEFERKGKELCVAYGTALITIHDLTRERDEALKEVEALKLQAQVWASEARAQKATVHACYEAITGKTGEPGDWNGAEPIRRYVAERDALALSQGMLLGALKNILSGISSCHYCGAELIPERGAAHCEDCPSGCEAHDAPDCVQLEELAEAAREAIAEATPEGETK